MTLFQLIAFPITFGMGLRSALRLLRGDRHRLRGILGTLLWIAAAVTILVPSATTEIANRLGIGRGTDLVTYLVALAFLWSWFYFHQKITRNTRHLTDLCRALAVERALRQYPPFASPPPERSGPELVD
jgi:small membrane protein